MALFSFVRVLSVAVVCLAAHAVALKFDSTALLELNKNYTIQTPNYPGKLPKNTHYSWLIKAPDGYRIQLVCPKISLIENERCQNERLYVSEQGRSDFTDAQLYCGTRKVAAESAFDRIAIALSTKKAKSPGFKCVLNTYKCDCGRRKTGSKIVNGVETAINEFPMMAGLIHDGDKRINCGATIISDRFAVTAYHCLIGKSEATTELIVGEHNVDETGESPYTKKYAVERFIRHSYNNVTREDDIALVMTRDTIQFNAGVSPVCLPFNYRGETFSGKKVEATGWGMTEFGGPLSKTLQKVTLDVIPNADCPDAASRKQMCTYTPNKDTCQNDSGGPLFYTDNNLLYLVGIVNFGDGCAFTPAVNLRVTEYLTWIMEQTRGTKYCQK